jgi:hypothetical protein
MKLLNMLFFQPCVISLPTRPNILDRPNEGGSKHLWNVTQFLTDYTTQYPRTQQSSELNFCGYQNWLMYTLLGLLPLEFCLYLATYILAALPDNWDCLFSTSSLIFYGENLLHPKSEDALCCDDKGPIEHKLNSGRKYDLISVSCKIGR